MTALKQTWDKNKSQVFGIIKSEYEAGADLNKIASRLNSLGLKSKTNKAFSKSIVCAIALYELNLKKRVEQSKHVFKKMNAQADEVKEIDIINQVADEEIQIDDNIVFSKDGKLYTNSLYVAKIFDKRHDHVLRDVRQVISDSKDSLPNFEESEYISLRGKKYPVFNMSERGFILLVMGFTGSKALQFKNMFLDKFEEMKAQLQKPKSELEILKDSVEHLIKINTRVDNIEVSMNNLSSEVRQLKTEKGISEKKKESLLEPERSLIIPLQKETRAKIRDLVDWYVLKSELTHQQVWNKLYKEFLLRYKINVKRRAEQGKLRPLSYIESIHMMEELFAIASEILVFPINAPIQNQIQQMNFLKEDS